MQSGLWNEEYQGALFTDDMFNKQDLSIEELMDNECYLNELKQLNPRLIQL